jgi:Holliday junction resolvase RusA-like endonuclease
MTFSAQQQIELLRLRSAQFPPSPIFNLKGPLVKKGGGKSRKQEAEFVRQIEEKLSKFRWVAPPRAKMEIEFHFFSDEANIPALHKLVKYYLDLLKGRAFRDDRQVHYLEAFRVIRPGTEKSICISFDRLSRRKQRLALYGRYKGHSIDWPDLSDAWLDSAGIPTHILQHSMLSGSKLEDWQQAGDPGVYRDYVRTIQASDPFTIPLGDLPRRPGETGEYKARVREAFQRFARRYSQLRKLQLPMELDIQVTPAGLSLGKDLDNIAQDVCPIFIEELLGGGALLTGFRVYVVDRLPVDEGGGIWVKLLPMGSILDQRMRVNNVIEAATERLSSEESW